MEELLNNLTGFLIWGSLAWFWIITSLFVLILFLSDIYENGFYAFASFLIFVVILHFGSNLELVPFIKAYWHIPLLYLGIGAVYALIRAYFYGKKPYDGYIDKDYTVEKIEKLRTEQLKSELEENIFRWWLLFPVSFLNLLCTDLIRKFFKWLYARLRGIFEYVLVLGIKSAPTEKDEE